MTPWCDIHTHHFIQPASKDITIRNYLVGVNNDSDFHSGFLYSVGVHPWYITDPEPQYVELEQMALQKNVVAIGEAGLDKLSGVAMEVQEDVFLKQVLLAEKIGKPLLIHCVKAWDQLLRIHKEIGPQVPWIVHGFRGNEVLAGQLIKSNISLSFGASFNPLALHVAWPNAFFTETDDKDIPIQEVYARLATTLSVSLPEFSAQVHKNVTDTFSV